MSAKLHKEQIMAKKIKVLTYNQAGFNKAVKHALSLGVEKTTLTFDSNKSSLVVSLGSPAKMMKSKAGYTPKNDPYSAILDLASFQACNHLNELTANKPAVKGMSKAECDKKVTKVADAAYDTGYGHGHEDGTTESAPQTTLKCVEVTVLVQNPIVWASMGIPYFKANGLDIVENDGKMFTVDTTANTSTEFTAAEAAKQIKADLLEGDDTIYTQFAKNFELIDSIKYDKVLVTEDQES